MPRTAVRTHALNQDGPVTDTGVVTVATKLPTGLLMRVFDMVEENEPTREGYKIVPRAYPRSETYTVHGVAVPYGQVPKCTIIGGYALTKNIPAWFWNMWLEQNHDSPLVKNKLIFAYDNTQRVEDIAKEHRNVRSGMEPLTLDDARFPRSVKGTNVEKVSVPDFSQEDVTL